MAPTRLVYGNPAANFYVSPRAAQPPKGYELPLKGTRGFDRARGREGDLVVVQLRSQIGQSQDRRAALRSLGLRKRESASLRLSSDSSTLGNIRKVRDLVTVISLPEVEYKSDAKSESADSDANNENYQYGTRNLPAHLWRSSQGDYFAYETGKQNLVAFWSTELSLDGLQQTLEGVGLPIDPTSTNGFVGAAEVETESPYPAVSQFEGHWHDLINKPRGGTTVAARIPLHDGLMATWRAPYQRFHDQEAVVGAVSSGRSNTGW